MKPSLEINQSKQIITPMISITCLIGAGIGTTKPIK